MLYRPIDQQRRRRSTARGGVLWTGLAALLGCSDAGPPARILIPVTWDTVMVVGTEALSDSTLVDPIHVLAWDDRVIVLEDLTQVVRAFDLEGTQQWEVGRRGRGPFEFAQAFRLFSGPDDRLWVQDGRNRKIVSIDRNGRLVRERYYRHLPAGVGRPISTDGGLLWLNRSTGGPAYRTDGDELAVIDSVRIPWVLPAVSKHSLDMRTVSVGRTRRLGGRA